MSDFGNVNEGLLAFSNKLKQQAAQTQPITNTETAPVAVPPVTPPPVVEPTKAPEKTEPAVPVASEPVKSEPPSTNPTPVEEVVEPWDGSVTKTAATSPAEEPLTLETISSALKLTGIKSKEDLAAQFSQREARIKELETAQDQQLADIPEELRDVVKIAKDKGDWKAYMGERVVDYTNADPVALFERQFELSPRFRKADGTIDYDMVDLELATIPQGIKEVQGNLVKQDLVRQQALRRNAIVQAAEQKAAQFNKGISDAAVKLPSILSKEKVGVVMEPKHSDYLYQGIRSGELIKKHFGNIDVSGADPEKLVRTLAAAEYLEGISQHQYKQGVVAGKKALLAEFQNVQLNSPAIGINPNQPTDKPKTPAEKLRQQMGVQSGPRL